MIMIMEQLRPSQLLVQLLVAVSVVSVGSWIERASFWLIDFIDNRCHCLGSGIHHTIKLLRTVRYLPTVMVHTYARTYAARQSSHTANNIMKTT